MKYEIMSLMFQGAVVAVKRIEKEKINLNRDMLLELKRVRFREFISEAFFNFSIFSNKKHD